jgi:Ala-tRNA(Pro) deacylase
MQTNIYDLLENLSIPFQRIHHPAVYTSEQARQLLPQTTAKTPKNLFLRDKKGKRYILLAVEEHKTIRFSDIESQTGLKHLSLASPQRLQQYLGVTPGAVSLLALINDPQGFVQVMIDRDLWTGAQIQAHPLVNTETLTLSIKDMEKFITSSGHAIQFVDIP